MNCQKFILVWGFRQQSLKRPDINTKGHKADFDCFKFIFIQLLSQRLLVIGTFVIAIKESHDIMCIAASPLQNQLLHEFSLIIDFNWAVEHPLNQLLLMDFNVSVAVVQALENTEDVFYWLVELMVARIGSGDAVPVGR